MSTNSPKQSHSKPDPHQAELLAAMQDPAGEWQRRLQASPAEVYDAALAAEGNPATVRVIRGKHSTTVNALFDEVSAALQFPPHCGRNFNALLDCLRDARDRLDAGLTLVIIDAGHLLSTDAEARHAFDLLLEQAHQDSADSLGKTSAKPFRVVLQA